MEKQKNKRYIGITIGPIFETIKLAVRPAGMWAGSYLFSYLSRKICEKLLEKGIKDKSFICPYIDYDKDEKKLIRNIYGVGMYPDKIIFQVEEKNISIGTCACWIKEVKEHIGEELANSLNRMEELIEIQNFVKNYLQVYIVERELEETKNPILELSPLLDSYELQRSFIQNQKIDPISLLIGGDKNDTEKNENRNIKKSFLVKDCEKDGKLFWDLLQEKNIWGIDDIARQNTLENFKRKDYYAVVQSDGDNIGKLLERLNEKEDIRNFSKCLFRYIEGEQKETKGPTGAIDMLRQYGAIPIYAGGDDLLFLAPLIGKNKESLFELLDKLSKQFYITFEEFIKQKQNVDSDFKVNIPTLSFGVSINHRKFPLYESFEIAGKSLFENAKHTKNKNTISLQVMKHSGRSFSMLLEKFSDSKSVECELYDMICRLLKQYSEKIDKDEEKVLQSVPIKLEENQAVFRLVKSKEQGCLLLENLFQSNNEH